MTTWIEEQLITVFEGRFAIPRRLKHPLDPVDPIKELERKEVSREIVKALSGIGEREATILKLRFGLATGETPLTLKETARRLRLSREKVRQIEERAILRLRRTLARTDILSAGI